jgi:flagellar biosynthesis/type III secretory pathway M-ring protein FliF/YscJ
MGIKDVWSKWGSVKKFFFAGIVLIVVAGIALLVLVSSWSRMVPVIGEPINNQETLDRFHENEKASLQNAANQILSKLGFDNFDIIVYAHKGINNRIVSKSILDTSWEGS